MEKKLTAMEKLKKKLNRIILSNNHSTEFELALKSVINDIDKKFIKQEREQIEDAFNDGYIDGSAELSEGVHPEYESSSDYFTQTYKQ